jgi:predicted nuclease with TOPRIM domain
MKGFFETIVENKIKCINEIAKAQKLKDAQYKNKNKMKKEELQKKKKEELIEIIENEQNTIEVYKKILKEREQICKNLDETNNSLRIDCQKLEKDKQFLMNQLENLTEAIVNDSEKQKIEKNS